MSEKSGAIDMLEKFVDELYELREKHLAEHRIACAAKNEKLRAFHGAAASSYQCAMDAAWHALANLRRGD